MSRVVWSHLAYIGSNDVSCIIYASQKKLQPNETTWHKTPSPAIDESPHLFLFLFSTLTSQRKHLRTLDGLSSSLCRSLDHRIVIFSDVMRRDHQFFCLTPYNTFQARSCRLIDDEIATQWKKLVPPKLNPPQICFTAF